MFTVTTGAEIRIISGQIEARDSGQLASGKSIMGYLDGAEVRFKNPASGQYYKTIPEVVLSDVDGEWTARIMSSDDIIEVEVLGGVDKTTGSENTVRIRAVSNLRNGDINVSPISTLTAALVDDEIASSTASISSIISKSETKAAIAFGIDVADLKVDPYQSDRADLVGISTNIQIAVKSFVNASLDPGNQEAVTNAIGSLASEVVKDIIVEVDDVTGEVTNSTSATFIKSDLQDVSTLQNISTSFALKEEARGTNVNTIVLRNAQKNVSNAISVVSEQGSVQDILKMKKVSITSVVNSAGVLKMSQMRNSVKLEPTITYKATTSTAPAIEFLNGFGPSIEVDKNTGFVEGTINEIIGPVSGTLAYSNVIGDDGWYGDYRRVPSATDWSAARPGTVYVKYQCRNGTEVTSLVQTFVVTDSSSPVIKWNDEDEEEVNILVDSVYDANNAVLILKGGVEHAVDIIGTVDVYTIGSYTQKYQAVGYPDVFLERVISVIPRPPTLIPLVSDPFQLVDGIYVLAEIHQRVDLDLKLEEYVPVAEIWKGGDFIQSPITNPSGVLRLTNAYNSKQTGRFTLTYNVGDDTGQILTATRLVTLYPEPADKEPPVITLSSTELVTAVQFIGPLPSLAATVNDDSDTKHLRVRPVHSSGLVGPQYTLTVAVASSTNIPQFDASALSVIGTTQLRYSCVDDAKNEALIKTRDIAVTPLKDAPITSANLNGLDLTAIDLQDVSWSYRVTTDGTVFDNANFTNATWTAYSNSFSWVNHATYGVKLSSVAGTNFTNATFSGLSVKNADLSNTIFKDATIYFADFSVEADASTKTIGDMSGAVLKGKVIFDNRDLRGCGMKTIDPTTCEIYLTNVDLRDEDLQDVVWSYRFKTDGLLLDGANLTNATWNSYSTGWWVDHATYGVKLLSVGGTNFTNAHLNSLSVKDVDLSTTIFTGATIYNADFSVEPDSPSKKIQDMSGVILKGAVLFNHRDLRGCGMKTMDPTTCSINFKNVDLRDEDLQDVVWTYRIKTDGLLLDGANMTNATWTSLDTNYLRVNHSTYGVNLSSVAGTDFTSTTFMGLSVKDADLSTTIFTDATIHNADFSVDPDAASKTIQDMSGVVLKGKVIFDNRDLRGCGLKTIDPTTCEVYLTNVDLRDEDLQDVVWNYRIRTDGLLLDGADMSNATWTAYSNSYGWVNHATYGVKLSSVAGTNFTNATFSGLSVKDLDLSTTIFKNATIYFADFSVEADASTKTIGDMSGAVLKGKVIFDNRDLRGCGMKTIDPTTCEIYLTNVDLRDEDLQDVVWSYRIKTDGLLLDGANLTNATWNSYSTGWWVDHAYGVKLLSVSGTNFTNAHLSSLSVKDVDLSTTIFTGATIYNADFSVEPDSPSKKIQDMSGVILKGAVLFDHRDLRGCGIKTMDPTTCSINFKNVDLRDEDLKDVVWTYRIKTDGLLLDGANMTNATWTSYSNSYSWVNHATHGVNLSSVAGTNFTNATFSGLSVRDVNLSTTIFKDATIYFADFSIASDALVKTIGDMSGVVLKGKVLFNNRDLRGCDVKTIDPTTCEIYFTDVDLRDEDLQDVVWSYRIKTDGLLLDGADLANATWTAYDTNYNRVNDPFYGVNLSSVAGTDFTNATFMGLSVKDADLSTTIFKDATIHNADFSIESDAASKTIQDMSGVVLKGKVIFDNRDLRGCGIKTIDPTTCEIHFKNVDLRNEDLRDVVWNYRIKTSGLLLDGANLTNATWNAYDSNYSRVNDAFYGVNLLSVAGTDFTNATFLGLSVKDADLSTTIFTNATIRNADFTINSSSSNKEIKSLAGATLNNVKFDGRDLSGMDLRSVTFSGSISTFTGCDLTNTVFTPEQVDYLGL